MKNRIIYFLLLVFLSCSQTCLFALTSEPMLPGKKDPKALEQKQAKSLEDTKELLKSKEDSLATCVELTGRVIHPTEPGYNQARLVSNFYTSKNKYPDVIVYCQNTQDVQNAVKWARCHKMPIRVRSGGHNHEGFFDRYGSYYH